MNRDWRPWLFIVLGIGAVLSAHYILDVCGDMGMAVETAKGTQVPMRCSWSERAFQGIAGLVALFGLAMLFFKDAARGLSLAVAGAGILVIVNTLWMVPTCGTATMVCNLSFKPGALLVAVIFIVAGLLGSLRLRRLDAATA